MTLSVVRQTSDNRVLAAFPEARDANTYSTGLGAGHDVVTIDDDQQGDDNSATIMGKVVSNAGVVSAYVESANDQRDDRRRQCYDLIEQAVRDLPSTDLVGNSATNTVMRNYLRLCFAAAAQDANMTNPMRFSQVEAACKGGDLNGGMREFYRLLATDATLRGTWSTATAGSIRVISSPDANGAVSAKAATVPADWLTNAAYDPVRAIAR